MLGTMAYPLGLRPMKALTARQWDQNKGTAVPTRAMESRRGILISRGIVAGTWVPGGMTSNAATSCGLAYEELCKDVQESVSTLLEK